MLTTNRRRYYTKHNISENILCSALNKQSQMTLKQLFLIPFAFLLLTNELNAQQWVSPCPRLFKYEEKNNEPNKWYGIVTLLTDTTLSGVMLWVTFDRPVSSLGNWFGGVQTDDHREFLIHNPKYELKAHVSQTVRFYVEYDSNKPAPQLINMKLNARAICPEQASTEAPPIVFGLQTSSHLDDKDNDPHVTQKVVIPAPASLGAQDSEAICGTVITQPTALITNGQATAEGEFPWHTALYHAKGFLQMYICGGSLITKSHVLTAGHCVTQHGSETTVNPEHLLVYLSKFKLKIFGNVGVQDRKVVEIIPHPMYSGRTYKNDIAVLKLSNDVDFTDYVRPICLWKESNDIASVVTKQGTVTGWGFDKKGILSSQLMQAQMPVVSTKTCVDSHPELYSRFTSPNTFCAGFRNGTSVCNGDSGGGMVFPRSDLTKGHNPVWHLRGVVSISIALQSKLCDTSNYVVFTDVAKYLDWIRRVI